MRLNSKYFLRDEKIVIKIKTSRWMFFPYYVLSFIFLPTIIAPIIFIWIAKKEYKGINYYVTNKRIIYDYDFFSRKFISIKFEKIQDLSVEQGFFEKFLNLGTIFINTAGSSKVELKLKFISKPFEIRDNILDIIEKKSNYHSCPDCDKTINEHEDKNKCPQCDFVNKVNVNFCSNCGHKLNDK